MNNIERRRNKRININININYDRTSTGKTKNICENGICIKINKNYLIGRFLKIVYKLPGFEKIMVIGIVDWSRKITSYEYEIGIEYWYIEEKDRKKTREYIIEQRKKTTENAYIDNLYNFKEAVECL